MFILLKVTISVIKICLGNNPTVIQGVKVLTIVFYFLKQMFSYLQTISNIYFQQIVKHIKGKEIHVIIAEISIELCIYVIYIYILRKCIRHWKKILHLLKTIVSIPLYVLYYIIYILMFIYGLLFK
jgi:hypothetical protein